MSKLAQIDGTTSGSNAVCLPISDRYSSKYTNRRTKRSVSRENITRSGYNPNSVLNKTFFKSTMQNQANMKNVDNETKNGTHSNETPIFILKEKRTEVLFNQSNFKDQKDLSKSSSYSQMNKSNNSRILSSNLINIRNPPPKKKELFWNQISFTNQTFINFNIINKSNHTGSDFQETILEEQIQNISSSNIINRYQDRKIHEQKKISNIYKNTTQKENKHINKVNISENNKLENLNYTKSIIAVSHAGKKLKDSIHNGNNTTAIQDRKKLNEKKSSLNNVNITVSRESEKVEEQKHNVSKVTVSQGSKKLSGQNYNVSNITLSRESEKVEEQKHNVSKVTVSQDSKELSGQNYNVSNITLSRESEKVEEQKHNVSKVTVSQGSKKLSGQNYNVSNITLSRESEKVEKQKHNVSKVTVSQDSKELSGQNYNVSNITLSRESEKVEEQKHNVSKVTVSQGSKKLSGQNYNVSDVTVSRESEKVEEQKHNVSKVTVSQDSKELSGQNYNVSNITLSRESEKVEEQKHNVSKVTVSQGSKKLSGQNYNVSDVTVSRESEKVEEQKHNVSKVTVSQDSKKLSGQNYNVSNITLSRESEKVEEQKHNVSKVTVSQDSKKLSGQNYNVSNITLSRESENVEEQKHNVSKVTVSQDSKELSGQNYNVSDVTVSQEKNQLSDQKYNFSEVTAIQDSKKPSDQKYRVSNVSNSRELKNSSQETRSELDKYRESHTKTSTGPKTNQLLTPTEEAKVKKYWKGSETSNMTSHPQREDLNSDNKQNMFYENSKTTARDIPSKNNYVIGNKAGASVNVESTLDYARLVGTRKYVACALCQAPGKLVQIMIPTATECPPEWNVEYLGYLMNYHHGTKHSQTMCVNEQALGISPESEHEAKKIISSYLSHVKIDCETHPCNENLLDEKLKCVVCSR